MGIWVMGTEVMLEMRREGRRGGRRGDRGRSKERKTDAILLKEGLGDTADPSNGVWLQ